MKKDQLKVTIKNYFYIWLLLNIRRRRAAVILTTNNNDLIAFQLLNNLIEFFSFCFIHLKPVLGVEVCQTLCVILCEQMNWKSID